MSKFYVLKLRSEGDKVTVVRLEEEELKTVEKILESLEYSVKDEDWSPTMDFNFHGFDTYDKAKEFIFGGYN